MDTPAYILSATTLTLFYNGAPVVAHNSHPHWADILLALKEGRYDDIVALARPIVAVIKFLDGDPDFKVSDGVITFQDEPIHTLIQERLFRHMKEGFPTLPLANFTRNQADNPSSWVADQLYPFIEKGNLPITEDGCFLAYKRIRSDWTDVYSGTVNYSLGAVVEMPRQKVDDNRDRTCSYGLHACSLDYLAYFSGDRIVAVKINPRDVVSVPADYHDTKLRCCRMEVVAELDNNLAAPAWTTPVFDYSNDADEDEGGAKNEDPPSYSIRAYDNFRDETVYWNDDGREWSPDYGTSYSDRELADEDAHELARVFATAVDVINEDGDIIISVSAPIN